MREGLPDLTDGDLGSFAPVQRDDPIAHDENLRREDDVGHPLGDPICHPVGDHVDDRFREVASLLIDDILRVVLEVEIRQCETRRLEQRALGHVVDPAHRAQANLTPSRLLPDALEARRLHLILEVVDLDDREVGDTRKLERLRALRVGEVVVA